MSSSGSSSSSDEEVDPSSEELLVAELSADAYAALRAHLDSKDADTSSDDETAAGGAGVSEDFGMSQFWYDRETSDRLAQEALEHAKGGVIAIISAPSAFRALNDMEPARGDAYIFEYDPRFASFGDAFVRYDFHEPERVPAELLGRCDYIMVDPPYLNPDAVAKFSQTIRLLARKPTTPAPSPEPEPSRLESDSVDSIAPASQGERVSIPVLYLSGAVVRDAVMEELGLKPCTFTPSFASKLSNQFHCYTNYESTLLGPFLDD